MLFSGKNSENKKSDPLNRIGIQNLYMGCENLKCGSYLKNGFYIEYYFRTDKLNFEERIKTKVFTIENDS